MPDDRSVVNEETVCDAGKANDRILFVGADRFVGKIPAGSNNREAQIMEKKMMERSIGQHDAEIRISRGD